MQKLIDKFGREHNYLRFSLIDKCNLNCFYCNPKDSKKEYMKKHELLSIEEILRLVRLFVTEHGIKKIRFTGGEALVRNDIPELFQELFKIKKENPFEMALTSNGTLLHKHLPFLKENGLDRINISLDSLNPTKFSSITGNSMFADVLKSIDLAEELGYDPVKINTVIIKNINDDEIFDFINFIKNRNINLRFIEFMPFANNNWSKDGLITYQEIKDKIENQFLLKGINSDTNSVAKDYQLDGYKGKVSFISSISDHFCNKCNRLRISASGKMKLCLFTNGKAALDLSSYLRSGKSDNEISQMLINSLKTKKEKHSSAEEILNYSQNEMLSLGG